MGRARSAANDAVSIPSRPRGRLQASRPNTDGCPASRRFNPQPAPWPAAGSRRPRSASNRQAPCFNPQPARWPAAGVTVPPAGMLRWFQSPAGPVAGCRRDRATRWNAQMVSIPSRPRGRLQADPLWLPQRPTQNPFQSPAGPVAGCRGSSWVTTANGSQFQSPAGPVAGCRLRADRVAADGHPRFQSPAGPVAGCRLAILAYLVLTRWCFNPQPAPWPAAGPAAGYRLCQIAVPVHVSIPSRPRGRLQATRRPCPRRAGCSCFNPQPAPWPAAGSPARIASSHSPSGFNPQPAPWPAAGIRSISSGPTG